MNVIILYEVNHDFFCLCSHYNGGRPNCVPFRTEIKLCPAALPRMQGLPLRHLSDRLGLHAGHYGYCPRYVLPLPGPVHGHEGQREFRIHITGIISINSSNYFFNINAFHGFKL